MIISYFYSFGLVRSDTFRPHIALKPERTWAYDFMNTKRKLPSVKNEHVLLAGQTEESPIDLIRKDRFETEYKLEDVDVIRHTLVDFFAGPMSVAALALVFKGLSHTYRNADGNMTLDWNIDNAYIALSILSFLMFSFVAIPYLLKTVMYPKKVLKEWQHPISGNMFSAISICLSLYGILMYDWYLNFGATLVWIAAIAQMGIAILRMSYLIYDYHSDEIISPALLMGPVGNFVSALALATYRFDENGNERGLQAGVNYTYISRFWFAVAALYAIKLFVITSKTKYNDPQAELRHRPLLWIYMAASAIAGPAYVAVSFGDVATQTDLLFQSLWLISVFFFAINVVGFARGFFTFVPDVSNWIYSFSSCALALITAQYYAQVLDTFTRVILLFSVSIACYLTGMSFLHTLHQVCELSLWTPRNKWGPASFMKLTHEAFRYATPNILRLLESITPEEPHALPALIRELDPYFKCWLEHSRHEDLCFFPIVRGYFPGLNESVDSEHHHLETKLAEFMELIKKGGEPEAAPAIIAQLKAEFPAWCESGLQHLRNEENTITVVIRKYTSLERQRAATRKAFDLTSTADWHDTLPYLLRNLPVPMWKLRLVRTFIWVRIRNSYFFDVILFRRCRSVHRRSVLSSTAASTPSPGPSSLRRSLR